MLTVTRFSKGTMDINMVNVYVKEIIVMQVFTGIYSFRLNVACTSSGQ